MDQAIIKDLISKNEQFTIPTIDKRPEVGLYIALIPVGEGSGKIMDLNAMISIKDIVTKDLGDLRTLMNRLKKTNSASEEVMKRYELRMRWVSQLRNAWTKYFAKCIKRREAKEERKKRKFEQAFEDSINEEFRDD